MTDFSLRRSANGVWFGVFQQFCAAGIKHGVSTRLHGQSQPPYASLNLGLKADDQRAAVIANRRLLCEAVGVNFSRLVAAQQVHSDHIAVVTEQDAGRGSADYAQAIPATDALVTNVPDLPLMLLFADCVPVLIADPVNKVVAVSHAGWKGTVSRIAQKTVQAIQQHFGTKPADCLVGIGPSIGACCYEVDAVVIDRLRANFPDWETFVKPQGEGHWLLDLRAVNRAQLIEIGVLPQHIAISETCTACNTQLFYSHRAEHGQTGRLAAIISL